MLTSWDNKQKQINLFDPRGARSSLKPRTGSVWLWLMPRRPMNAAKRIAETWICQTKGDQRKFIKFNASSNEVSKLILKSLLVSKHVESTTHKKLNPKSFRTTCLCFLCLVLDLFEVFCVKNLFVRSCVGAQSLNRQATFVENYDRSATYV